MQSTFATLSLGAIKRQYALLQSTFPTTKFYYAVKCNNYPKVIQCLVDLGSSFDCASIREIQFVLSFGVDPGSRIIFANPHRSQIEVDEAVKLGVEMMTFDSESQLLRLRSVKKPLLRMCPPSQENQSVKLGVKFGADIFQAHRLLSLAHSLGVNISGLCFHMGYPIGPVTPILSMLKTIQIPSSEFELQLSCIDFGGGFDFKLPENCLKLNEKLKEIQKESSLELQCEPGRFLVQSAVKYFTRVEGKNDGTIFVNGSCFQMFFRDMLKKNPIKVKVVSKEWIQNYILNENKDKKYETKNTNDECEKEEIELNEQFQVQCKTFSENQNTKQIIIRGSSGMQNDVFYEGKIGDIEVGDYIMIQNAGAYTISCMSQQLDQFCGMNALQVVEVE
ncbi:Ornithine_decarboxylase [Hexamita inflata]|uniref:ornithine decarboxylase n=1 Tax=Hexamita inflata TaxID=28002 RepID=A0AA86UPC0_9EUKA|nr:Ornithine decarboxylase [Hexamita inflata]